MTGGLNQVRVSSVVYDFTPGMSSPFPLLFPSPVLPVLPSPLSTPLLSYLSVLSYSSAISDAAIDRLPQVDTNNDVELRPSLPETNQQQISSSKCQDPTQFHRKSTSTAGPG
ncbi:unnamed protein product [Schistocephalus solidus]|uniref:Uncharacterized protein n=1 Tax=Schistocephalus solidus TaxID=70667 RepID=A0A183SC14_SCHSO|nr:unnamed protein product [Schistocephalus solidus]